MAKSVKKIKRQIVAKTLDKVKQSLQPKIFAEAMANSIIMVLAFEHIDRHHTGTWLRKWLTDFDDFSQSVKKSGEPISSLCQILRDECNFDVLGEYKAICEKADKSDE